MDAFTDFLSVVSCLGIDLLFDYIHKDLGGDSVCHHQDHNQKGDKLCHKLRPAGHDRKEHRINDLDNSNRTDAE